MGGVETVSSQVPGEAGEAAEDGAEVGRGIGVGAQATSVSGDDGGYNQRLEKVWLIWSVWRNETVAMMEKIGAEGKQQ